MDAPDRCFTIFYIWTNLGNFLFGLKYSSPMSQFVTAHRIGLSIHSRVVGWTLIVAQIIDESVCDDSQNWPLGPPEWVGCTLIVAQFLNESVCGGSQNWSLGQLACGWVYHSCCTVPQWVSMWRLTELVSWSTRVWLGVPQFVAQFLNESVCGGSQNWSLGQLECGWVYHRCCTVPQWVSMWRLTELVSWSTRVWLGVPQFVAQFLNESVCDGSQNWSLGQLECGWVYHSLLHSSSMSQYVTAHRIGLLVNSRVVGCTIVVAQFLNESVCDGSQNWSLGQLACGWVYHSCCTVPQWVSMWRLTRLVS